MVLSVSTIAAANWWLNSSGSTPEFFVGVEFAYSGNVNDVKALVDKAKDYTNLFVIGSIEISFNQTALNESCDYVVDSGLYLIVFITDSETYSYDVFDWGAEAKQKYGDMFLGVYRYDEPGGHQLDLGPSILVDNAENYTDMADKFSSYLNILISYHKNYSDTVITADYGLYWFDYKAGYTAVLTEFGWNHSRPLHTGLCRGAAEAYNRDWGAIVTWTYNNTPFIYSREELYSDLKLAYNNGAKYAVVFNYPVTGSYGILTEDHFGALKDFWNYVNSNPQEHGVIQGEVAYVLPKDYGFGFRHAEDKIWGLWEADELSQKVWDDVNTLLDQYGSRLDIVYDDPEVMGAVKNRYDKLFFWNETIA
ncbi:hypothetical protein JW988_03055 [Candidatus Bathyarchaeota archaeon]|nr:hypothetical protein [Candidatus Bathyarchaeota archaeon]